MAGVVQSWGWKSRQGEDGHCLSEEGRGDPWGHTPLEEGVHWAPGSQEQGSSSGEEPVGKPGVEEGERFSLGSPRVGLGL